MQESPKCGNFEELNCADKLKALTKHIVCDNYICSIPPLSNMGKKISDSVINYSKSPNRNKISLKYNGQYPTNFEESPVQQRFIINDDTEVALKSTQKSMGMIPRIINFNDHRANEGSKNIYCTMDEQERKSHYSNVKFRNGNAESCSQTRTLERTNSTTFSTINIGDSKTKKGNRSQKRETKGKLRIINEGKNYSQIVMARSFKKPVFKVFHDPRFIQHNRVLPELVGSNDSYGLQQPTFSILGDKKVR